MRHSLLSVLAVSAALFVSSSAQAGSLVNGGFEAPVVTVGSFQNFNAGSDIAGWTVVRGQVSVVSDTFSQNGLQFHAHSGAQWLDLTGLNDNSAEGVEQSIDTVAGANYSVSFWVGNVVNTGGIFGTTSTVNLLIDGTLKLAATNSDGTTQQVWKEFVVPFKATGALTTLRFLNGDPITDNDNGLDGVSVEFVSGPVAAVPLPPAALGAMELGAVLFAGKSLSRLIGRRVCN